MAWCLQAQVLVSTAGIYFEGAKALPGPKQNIFDMTMRHNGSPVFKGINGVTQRFSHGRRDTTFIYNLQTNETEVVGDLTGGDDLVSQPRLQVQLVLLHDYLSHCHIATYCNRSWVCLHNLNQTDTAQDPDPVLHRVLHNSSALSDCLHWTKPLLSLDCPLQRFVSKSHRGKS